MSEDSDTQPQHFMLLGGRVIWENGMVDDGGSVTDQIKIPKDEQYKRAMQVVRRAEQEPIPGWLNTNVRAAVALMVNADFIKDGDDER